MRLLERIFKFYIDSSIHVALAVMSLLIISGWELGVPISKYLLLFVFFGTITGYNFIKYVKDIGLHFGSLAYPLKAIFFFSSVCLIGTLFFIAQLPVRSWWVIVIFGVITFFYVIPVLKNKSLRSFSGLKIFIVGIVWAGITVLLPWVNNGETIVTIDVWLTFFQRVILVVVLTLPFEIRDVYFDDKKLITLPQWVGIRKTKILGTLSLILVGMFELLKDDISQQYLISLVLFCSMTIVLLWNSSKKQSLYYASFWVEAIPIFWWLFYLVIK